MRILIVSLGSIGKRHLANTLELLPDCEVCIWRMTASQNATDDRFTVVYDQEGAIKFSPDAVIVASPASRHMEAALPFIRANVPAFIEKPLAANVGEVSGFLGACDASSGFVMVGYVLRFQPVFHAIKKALVEGVIGRVLTAHAQTGQYLPDWRPDSDYRNGVSAKASLGGGVLLELSHELDYTRWLFGQPDYVVASVNKYSDLEIDVEDSALVIYEYERMRVTVETDFFRRAPKMSLQIVGSEGSVEADLIAETIIVKTPESPDGVALDVPKCSTFNDVYLRQFDLFFDKTFDAYVPWYSETRGNPTYATPQDAVAIMQIIDSARRSNAHGTRIDLI
ncbi:Gfo/Idh/MocA family oxidoreductase [Rhodobacteraceae bacterium]|nr:Gfo/Idh/MocA family oxidoreductase [Paracoccaceae bacterium]